MGHLAYYGQIAATAGMAVIAYSATLPDSEPGSPRSIGTAIGGLVAAAGTLLVALGKFGHPENTGGSSS